VAFSQYLNFKDLAGYNAARGDFDWESDNLAEMELNVIEANDDLYRLIATNGQAISKGNFGVFIFPIFS
jgi:hypothetical protein